ncbi:amidohydrolase family protein [Bythopirellula goksoeyrii]|uniref:Amidohydrolase n=1 Tax=Bythopirellula goksoeyrii TaxID=1400387 RepID=A0A5B9QCS0_9BACT|nr:amidohydrolase family protein [Bythopirellula goksoeyrii]QEG36684.1 Amidohydrolase [Bythopirellula goksoeyrii]
MRIDAHQHYWRYDAIEYDWIDDSMQRIRRDFLPKDLQPQIQAAGIEGVISVQARQSLTETKWLLQLADENEFIRGVVGWVPLVTPIVGETLQQLATNPKLRAVRHVVQDEPDDDFILRDDFNQGIGLLQQFDLAYDILIFERQLTQTIAFVDRHPNQVFILDHIAKPRIGANLIEPWRRNITNLAKRQNVYCKLSGMVTEGHFADWSSAQLRPYWEVVLQAFGPSRLMFGSDWPVCLVACDYVRWFETVVTFAAQLSEAEQQSLFGATAVEAYSL